MLAQSVRCAGFVAIVGRPNAGKSSLSNAMVGQKLSSVTAKAQTTRHRLLSIVSEPGFQMILLDTPGILQVHRKAARLVHSFWHPARGTTLSRARAQNRTNELDTRMMGSVATARRDADALLAIVDCGRSPEAAAEELQLTSGTKPGLPTALVCLLLLSC